jgi:hypothetical protein
VADIEKTGDWDGFAAILAKASSQFKSNVKDATNTSGRLLEGKIVQRISSGQVMPATSPRFTAWKEAHGYSGTTLIMTSSLINAIKYENKDWAEGFVGVKRSAVSNDGKSLINVALAHEYGKGRKSRPFIRPVIESEGPKIAEVYQQAIDETFKK